MKKPLLIVALMLCLSGVNAQIAVTSTSLTYAQNFDALDTFSQLANASASLPTGWDIFEYGNSATRVDNKYVGNTGSSSTGDTYSYGRVGSNERALGSVAAASITSHFGATFINNTGASISGFTLRYRGEQWRFGSTGRTNPDSLRFLFSTLAIGVSDTTSLLYTESAALLFSSPNIAGTIGAMDGNLAGNFATITGTETVNVLNGEKLVIKWIDRNIGGSDDGLAIDSVFITFTTTPSPLPRPLITSLAPANGAAGVAPGTNPTIGFSRAIQKGTGNIHIKNETARTVQTIAVTDPGVSVSGKTAVLSGVTLASGQRYHVMFDSTAFDTAGFRCLGIYDTTAWRFTTSGTGFSPMAQQQLVFFVVQPATNGLFVLNYSSVVATRIDMHIFDATGRRWHTESQHVSSSSGFIRIPADLPAGTYFIRVSDGVHTAIAKAVMQ